MGTRSITVFKEDDGTPICAIYRQFDGYPDGHGKDLYSILHDMELVNGIPFSALNPNDDDLPAIKIANGMSCLAAQVIMYLKSNCHSNVNSCVAGNIYMCNIPESNENLGVSYLYEIYCKVIEKPTTDKFADIYMKIISCYDNKVLLDFNVVEEFVVPSEEEDE